AQGSGSFVWACRWPPRETYAINRKSRTRLQSCCKTSSEKTKALAAWSMVSQVFRSARRSSWKSFSRWRSETNGDAHDAYITTTHDFLSHDAKRRGLHLLSTSRAEKRGDAATAARTALLLADVRTSLRAAFGSLSPRRARLPGLRTQRLARSEKIRVHVRSLRRGHESLHRDARASALYALHARLRRPRRFS